MNTFFTPPKTPFTVPTRVWLTTFLVSLVLLTLPLFAAVKTDLKDTDISEAVEREMFADKSVAAHLIDAETNAGIVTLTGKVDTLLAKEKAEALAETIKGTRSVINRIEVNTPERLNSELRKDILIALVNDPATESYEINVTAEDGHVTLTGETDSWAEKQIAAQVAKSVIGVKSLTDKVKFKHVDNRLDIDIKADIERRIELDPWIFPLLVDVAVDDGKVELSGTVGSLAVKRQVSNKSWVAGVTNVNNDELKVSSWARADMKRQVKHGHQTDSELVSSVEDAMLFDPRVKSFKIDVTADNGFITLKGEVDNLKAKEAAANDARNTRGVWGVANKIKVRPTTVVADHVIRQEIIDAIARHALLPRSDLQVSVFNGKVFLNGHVSNNIEKTTAGDVATRIAGVAAVENNIEVSYDWMWKSDWILRQDVRSQLYWDPYIDDGTIVINVEKGVVTLTGTVDTFYEKIVATENAWDAGVKDVVNKLKVEQEFQVEKETDYSPYLDPSLPNYYGSPLYPSSIYGG